MNILHLSSARTWRGGEQQIAYLHEGIRRQAPGARQWVFCPQGSALADWCAERGQPLQTYVKHGGFSLRTALKLKTFCREQRIDLVHLHDSHAHTYGVLAGLLGNPCPLVLSRRVDFPPSRSPFSRFKYRYARIRRILCVSEAIRRIMQAALPADPRLHTVHSGIDLARFREVPPGQLRAELGLLPSSRLAMKVAALAPHKDYYTFLRVAELAMHSGPPDLHFVAVGADGGERAGIERQIAERGLGGRVHLLGFRSDVPALLAQADVFLFTSKEEGLGTSVLDAMASGLPVVSTEAGGIPEMVRPGESGLLAPVGDAAALYAHLQRVLADAGLAQHLAAGGRAVAEAFSTARTTSQTLAHYTTVLAGA